MAAEDQNQASSFWTIAPFPTLVAATRDLQLEELRFLGPFLCYSLDQDYPFQQIWLGANRVRVVPKVADPG